MPRFTITTEPYDDDRSEMVCRDNETGETYEIPPFLGWQARMADWIERQKAKTAKGAA